MQGEGIFRSKRELKNFNQSSTNYYVGPGAYESLMKERKIQTNQFHIPFLTSQVRQIFGNLDKKVSPGPGQYSEENSNLINRSYNNNHPSFGSKTKRKKNGEKDKEELPGPGSYYAEIPFEISASVNPPKRAYTQTKNKRTKSNIQGRLNDSMNLVNKKNVGPGSYNPKITSIKNGIPVLLKYSQISKDINNRERLNKLISELKQLNPRDDIDLTNEDGSIKINTESHFFKSSSKKDSIFLNKMNKFPGPGAYDPKKFNFQDNNFNNVSSSTFSKSKKYKDLVQKDNFLLYQTKPELNPPVGLYNPGVGAKSKKVKIKPTSQFSSKCPRDLSLSEKKTKIPGPGSYSVDKKKENKKKMKVPFGNNVPRFFYNRESEINDEVAEESDEEDEEEQPQPRSHLKSANPYNAVKKGAIASENVERNKGKTNTYGFGERDTWIGTNSMLKDDKVKNSSHIEDIKDTISKRYKVKVFIQNAVNAISGIAFNAHSQRFKPKSQYLIRTPGPGEYGKNIKDQNISISKSLIPKRIVKERFKGNELFDGTKISGMDAKGPGSYFKDTSLIKNSYNITLPQNILKLRKEDLIKMRLNAFKM